MDAKLKEEFDALFGNRFAKITGDVAYTSLRNKIIDWKVKSIPVDKPVIRAIVCHDILPSPPEWDKQIQNLKFKYREYYVEIYYEEKFIGYMDCKAADNIKTEKDFGRVCYKFTKDFYTMLSNYMSF